MFSVKKRRVLYLMFVLAIVVALPGIALATSGFLTPEPPMLTLDPGMPSGSRVKAIINVGEEMGDFLFEGLPDGIGLAPGPSKDSVNVFVAHEQTTVPFFGSADFQDASVSKLTLNTRKGSSMGAVLSAEVALPPDAGFLRFCSAFMAGPAEGFSNYTFFANEEANDDLWVLQVEHDVRDTFVLQTVCEVGEKHERRETGRADRITLRDGLRCIAYCVQRLTTCSDFFT